MTITGHDLPSRPARGSTPLPPILLRPLTPFIPVSILGAWTASVLIERALELFAARGYDAVGVQEIVEAAGMTKPTLYHWFGSKQGLLRAALASREEGRASPPWPRPGDLRGPPPSPAEDARFSRAEPHVL